jgi:hypothetical protein
LAYFYARKRQKPAFTDEIDANESDREYALNCIYFYQSLENGLFNDHKEDWVLVHQQKIVKYGRAITNQQMVDLELELPGALYIPVNSSLREKFVNPKARAVHSKRRRIYGLIYLYLAFF